MIDPTLADKHVRELGELRELISLLKDNLRQAKDEMARKNTVIVQLRAELHTRLDQLESNSARQHAKLLRLQAKLKAVLNDPMFSRTTAFEEAAKMADADATTSVDLTERLLAKAKEVQG